MREVLTVLFSSQGQVTVAILAAEKDVQAIQKANDSKFRNGFRGKKLKGASVDPFPPLAMSPG